ncbi:MAG: amidase [Chloroflexi bacterium]|nr:amidase [Chloroflexota bacterium]
MTTATSLHYLSIAEAGELIKSKQISPVELTQVFLDRIAALDSQLLSFITVTSEFALKQAKASEAKIMAGEPLGLLEGIPIALKDLYATKGILTTAHSRLLMEWVPTEDATSVAKLYDAGAILLGKLAMHEFASGSPIFEAAFPPARNPWNVEHIPGGSSSGSGAAVAAGLAMGSLGSDTGGSIRGPASFCGLVGLKPTYGLVSRTGVLPLSWSLDHAGPMTWTAEDCALMLQAIAGYDPTDPGSANVPVGDYLTDLKAGVAGMTFGIPRSKFYKLEDVNPETLAAVEAAIEVLKGLGATVKEVEFPSLKYIGGTGIISPIEAFTYHQQTLKDRPMDYGESIRTRFRVGGLFSGADYLMAQRMRLVIKEEFAEVMKSVDALITPTSNGPATRFDGFNEMDRFTRTSFTRPFNVTGQPALSINCGFTESGLPIGLQIAGKAFDDATVLRVAYAYEQATPWHTMRPSL